MLPSGAENTRVVVEEEVGHAEAGGRQRGHAGVLALLMRIASKLLGKTDRRLLH
jgi:hypothetical protein